MMSHISATQVLVGTVTLAAAGVLISLIEQRRLRRAAIQKGCSPPTSWYPCNPLTLGFPFLFEHVFSIINCRFAAGVRESFDRYGKTYAAWVGYRSLIITIDPENLEAMMQTNFEDYAIIPHREKLVTVLLGRGVFATSGNEWQHSRMLARRGMAKAPTGPEVLEAAADEMVRGLKAEGGNELDFAAFSGAYTMAVAKKVFFGVNEPSVDSKDIAEDSHDFARDFSHVKQMARSLTFFINVVPYLANLTYAGQFKRTQRRLFNYVDRKVKAAFERHASERTGSKQERPKDQKVSVVYGLALASQELPRLRTETLNLFLAGQDTVGTAFTELMYLLSANPDVWSKLREEVAQVIGSTAPSIDDLKRMPYLSNVIKEGKTSSRTSMLTAMWLTCNIAFRLQPTLSVHGRKAIRNTVLPRGGGADGRDPIFVRRGCYFVYSNYALHRDEAVFGSNVDAFRPERWDDISPTRYEYLPFGAGPRRCPGKEMGWTTVAFATARLAQEFKAIKLVDNRPWTEGRAFSFFNSHGVKVILTPA